MLSVDGEDSTEDDPIVVTGHLLVISPNCKHNHHSVHEVGSLVAGYLNEINCPVSNARVYRWLLGAV